jgi:N-acetylmuramoyl-L-alanine amidase
MSIVISSGHGKYIRGASGYLDEVDEARKVVDEVAKMLKTAGVSVKTFHDNTSHDQSTNLHTIVNYHNAQDRELDVSVHFNAYETTSKPMGTEVLYVTQSELARTVSVAISDAGDFIDRGPKKRTDLYFLNNTEEPAILIETCFVDSSTDANLYDQNFTRICQSIAESISGEPIGEPIEPPVEPPVEPPAETGIGTVVNVSAGDQLNIRASASSSGTVIGRASNGATLDVVGQSGNWYKCSFYDTDSEVGVFGWVSGDYLRVEGELPAGEWHDDITATQFGGGGDEQEGAYGDYITGSTRGVAFPYKWRDSPRPRVIVKGPSGEVETDVVDVGPWNTDDPDYVLGTARPLSESQYKYGTVAQNGQVPSNDAGIDLTDPIAREVGISGKGKVSWKFAEDVA